MLNLATDAAARAAYDEPGSWGRLSEGWPETPYTKAKWLACTQDNIVPYGQYVVVGTRRNERLHNYDTTTPLYDYSQAVIRVATPELRTALEAAVQ